MSTSIVHYIVLHYSAARRAHAVGTVVYIPLYYITAPREVVKQCVVVARGDHDFNARVYALEQRSLRARGGCEFTASVLEGGGRSQQRASRLSRDLR